MRISLLKIIFTLVFSLIFLPSVVSAGTEHNMSGWAWSSNIGWVKALSADGSGWDGWISLAGVNYGVVLGTHIWRIS